MCGRFVAISDPDGLVRFLVIDERRGIDLPANYNVAPTQEVYAATAHEGRRYLLTFKWGLVPAWDKDPRTGTRRINARAESLDERPAFRDALARRRCLIPADGFYEWTTTDDRKHPHFIHRRDGQPLVFAGLWASWTDPSDPTVRLRTCTIVTRSATAAILPLHDRMPVMLPEPSWDAWLDPDTPPNEALAALRAEPPDLTFHPVSERVNDHRVNDPSLIEPVSHQFTPPLTLF